MTSQALRTADEIPGSPENLRELSRLLSGWRCCGAPNMCGERCIGDELSYSLAQAAMQVRRAMEDRT